MKKVFMLNTLSIENIGGVEKYCRSIRDVLINNGYEVIKIVGCDDGNLAPDDICWNLSMNTGLFSLWKNLRKVKKKYKKLQKQNKDAIFIISSYYYNYANLKKSKIIQIQHSDVKWVKNYLEGSFIRKHLFRKKKHVKHLINYPGGESLIKMFKCENNSTMVVSQFEKHEMVVKKPNKNILYAGRLDDKDKDYSFAVEVAKHNPDFHFNFHGNGSDEEVNKLKGLIKDLPNATYHGGYKPSDLKKMHENNFAQLMTSRAEGMPIALLESASFGTPIISVDTYSSFEFLKEHKIVVPTKKDVELFSETINDVYKNSVKYGKEAYAGVNKIRSMIVDNVLVDVIKKL